MGVEGKAGWYYDGGKGRRTFQEGADVQQHQMLLKVKEVEGIARCGYFTGTCHPQIILQWV